MLLIGNPISFGFYFTLDGLIVIHNTDYKIVQDVYNKYYEKYGDKHTYYLYTVAKYDLKK
jgi:hypothetical protein